MALLNSLRIKNVRHIEDLTLTDLGDINLLFGANDSGKSSVLEAIALWCDPLNPYNWQQVAKYRTTWPFFERGQALKDLESISWLFRQTSQQRHLPISLSGEGSSPFLDLSVHLDVSEAFQPFEEEQDLIPVGLPQISTEQPQIVMDLAIQGDLSVSSFPLFPTTLRHLKKTLRFWESTKGKTSSKQWSDIEDYRPLGCEMVNNLAHRSENLLKRQFSNVIRSNYKTSVIEALRILDPEIEDLAILTPPEDTSDLEEMKALRGETVLQIKHQKTGFLPISSYGDGIRRILHIAFQLPKLRGGVLLIDEIEVSIHAKKLGVFFDWLIKNCRLLDIQLFATTHSLEAIDALLGEQSDTSDRAKSITAFRLQQGTAKRFGGEQLKRLRLERGLEVRG